MIQSPPVVLDTPHCSPFVDVFLLQYTDVRKYIRASSLWPGDSPTILCSIEREEDVKGKGKGRQKAEGLLDGYCLLNLKTKRPGYFVPFMEGVTKTIATNTPPTTTIQSKLTR